MLKTYFFGQFTFVRHVSDPNVVLHGEAKFEPISGNESHYREWGHYNAADTHQEFYQSRIFQWELPYLRIIKNEGDILHELWFAEDGFPAKAQHLHICHEDHYELLLELESPEVFFTHYQVKGPHKDHTILTKYTRQSEG